MACNLFFSPTFVLPPWMQLSREKQNKDYSHQNNKQLLDEAEHDIKNYRDRGQRYLLKPKAENIDRGLDNS